MPAPGQDRLSARAFRALLALYPAAFRDEYGYELSLVFADRYRDAAGSWDRILIWLEALAGELQLHRHGQRSEVMSDAWDPAVVRARLERVIASGKLEGETLSLKFAADQPAQTR